MFPTKQWSSCHALSAGRRLLGLEQADAQILGLVDAPPIRFEPTIGDAENQLGAKDPLEIDPVDDLLDGRQHLVGELDLADPERPAPPRAAEPAEEEPDHLPQGIHAET